MTITLLHPTQLCREIMQVHCRAVYQKALQLAEESRYADAIDYVFLEEAVMLHDYGIIGVDAPDIGCEGREPYIAHGVIGAEYLRSLDRKRYARHARVCERHIGSGLTAKEIVSSSLPLPVKDFLPETLEEKLITYADNYFSKNPAHLTEEKSFERVVKGMERFGEEPVRRLLELHDMWRKRDD